MRIKNYDTYKDGGTLSLKTDQGIFLVDRCGSSGLHSVNGSPPVAYSQRGKVTIGDINDDNRPEASKEQVLELMKKMKKLGRLDSYIKDIRKYYFNH